MDLEELYKSFTTDERCKDLLLQSHWFASFADFDPRTGETLPMSLSRALERISSRERLPFVKDRLWLLMKHSEESARRLMKSLSEEPRRESAYLPIREVRELDTASFIALSRRPGRNIRQKLADKPYMQAVRHYQSIDVPENRLLKTYLIQLADALELRKKYLKDKNVEEFLQTIYRWLNEGEIREIARWENLAPNNALLSHRDYRRIWNSWRLLQTLEDDIDRDMQHLEERRATRSKWDSLAKRFESGNTVFADMPIFIDYNHFDIRPWDSSLPVLQTTGIKHASPFFETSEPACIDLTQIQPLFATPTCSGQLEDSFFWQRWKSDDEEVDLELFEADAIYDHENSVTLTCSDMFFWGKNALEELNKASRSFTLRLGEHFHNSRMIWISPDCLNEFELETVRRNINASFPKAEPLPCSVATVFEHVNYSDINKDGFRVAVVERINKKACLTEMIARYHSDLKEALPETRGFVWERGVTELISTDVGVDLVEGKTYLLNKDGSWTKECNPYGVSHSTDEDVPIELDDFDLAFWLNGRPVKGGIKLFQLQSQVPNIPLWRNHIPELWGEVYMAGRPQYVPFVGKVPPIAPIRGKAVKIDNDATFTLPAGMKSYRLPLVQGTNKEAMEYEAILQSKEMPFAEDVECRLEMSYTYGVDDPYELFFVPVSGNHRVIHVIWRQKAEDEQVDVAGPQYPEPLTWRELQNQKKKDGSKSDFLEWNETSFKKLFSKLSWLEETPLHGTTYVPWRTNKYGKHFIWARTDDGNEYYIHQNALTHGTSRQDVSKDDEVFFYLGFADGKERAEHVSLTQRETRRAVTSDICSFIHRMLYITTITIWSDGRSVVDAECPASFKQSVEANSRRLDKIQRMTRSYPVKQEIRFLLCCMGADTPDSFGWSLVNDYGSAIGDEKGMGFALGAVTSAWQQALLEKLLNDDDARALRVLGHAIWRNSAFVEKIPKEHISPIAERLIVEIGSGCTSIMEGQFGESNELLRSITKYLELLLGLLRTRNLADPSLSTILQPYQEITKRLSNAILNLIDVSMDEQIDYHSRIVLDLSSKPEDDLTPDLLYALRLYLTGDESANMIRVTGIVEDD